MGEVLTNGVYLPDRGERNAYDGLKGNWNTLDSIAGKVPGYDAHISDTDIHVTAADKQTWNGKADASHVHNADDVTTGVFDAARIPNLDASKITTGTIDIDRLPQGALERLVKVADQAARYALTASDVQLGDTVQQLDTGVMYVVTDVTKLDSADGYTEYTAGSATSVPWSGVTGKPADYTPASHSHGNITNDGKVGTTANLPLITGTDGVVQAGSFGNAANTFCEGNDSRLSDARTPVAHTHTKSDVTDLFNSANTWTENNTFSKQVCLTKVNDTSLKSQNSRAELGETNLSGDTYTQISFEDKNGDNFGYLRQIYGADGNNGFHFFVRNKFLNGVPDTTGTVDYSYFGLRLNPDKSKEAVFKANLRPYDSTFAYNLGDATYQWNNLYAKNYYYNGVAWGLDKSNVWSQNQAIASNNPKIYLKNMSITKGVIPSGNLNCTFMAIDSAGEEFGRVLSRVTSAGATYTWLAAHNLYKNGTLDTTGTDVWANVTCYINAAGIPHVEMNCDLYPNDGINNANLGTSTNKWKSLNGINPGALSIPDGTDAGANSSFTPDTTDWPKDGTAFQANMPIVGWLRITIKNVAGNYAFVRRGTAGANLPWHIFADPSFAADFAECTLNVPVTNATYTLKINSPGGFTAKVYPCLGNV